MSTEIVMFNFKKQAVRGFEENGVIWLCAKDVCDRLELSNNRKAMADLAEDEVCMHHVPHPQSENKQLEMLFVSESGLYRLIFKSRKPEAKKFRRWVTHEVLPSLRKTGSYSLSKAPEAELLRELQKINPKKP